MTEFLHIAKKLDKYISLKNRYAIVGGLVLSIFIASTFFLSSILLDFVIDANPAIRKAFFYLLLSLSAFSAIYFVFIPLYKAYRFSADFRRLKAAKTLKSELPDVQDYLLNLLELEYEIRTEQSPSALRIESIKQKSGWISKLDFSKAIQRKPFVRILYMFGSVVLLYVFIYFLSPVSFVQSAERIIYYDKKFPKHFPFDIELVNDTLLCDQFDNFTLQVKVKGEAELPNFWIRFPEVVSKVTELKNDTFYYQLKALKSDLSFIFEYGEYQSEVYTIRVIPKTLITSIQYQIVPPAYTLLHDTVVSDLAMFPIAVNSQILLHGSIINSDSLFVNIGKKKLNMELENGKFKGRFYANVSDNMTFMSLNDTFGLKTVQSVPLSIIPDRSPDLAVESYSDSIIYTNRYLSGFLSDDYGISSLWLYVSESEDKTKIVNKIPLPFSKLGKPQEIFYLLDFNSIDATTDLVFWVRAYDNDAPAGFKFSDSKSFYYKQLSLQEEQEITDNISKELENKSDDADKILDNFRKLVVEQKKEILSGNNNWNKTKINNNLLENKDQLQNVIEELNNTLNQLSQLNNSERNLESLQEKEKAIQDMLNSIMNEELKKLLDEISKLDSEADSKKLNELNQKLDNNFKDLEERLNSTLESLKRYEVEQRLDNLANNIEELSEEHKDAAELTKKSDEEQLKKELEEQSKTFDMLKEELENIKEKNSELKNPYTIDDQKSATDKIEQTFDELQNDMNNGKAGSKSTQNKMQKNAEQMEQLAMQLQNNLNQMSEDELSKSIEEMRQMLDNILKLSFDQENVINRTKRLSTADPGFADVSALEYSIIQNYNHVEDSLRSLVSIYPQLGTVVNTELTKIRENSGRVLTALDNRQANPASVYQQFVLTSFNNLALMLAESIEKSKKDMNNMKGSGSGKSKSKKNGEGFEKMGKQGEDFKKQLEQLLQDMKNGVPMNKLGDQLGKMLMMQEMMQMQVNELMLNNSISPDNQSLLKEINNLMEQNKSDIVNRKISQESINRQQQILTRLLKAENAEKERDNEEKRESKTSNLIQKDINNFIKKSDKFKSAYKVTIGRENILLRNYYQKKISEYNTNLQELDK